MASDEVVIQTTISSWEQVIKRVGTLCLSCSEEQLLVEVAPAKNRISYLWGHLTAVNDAMFSVLRLGERLHPELDAVFIAQPDRSVPHPSSTEIAKCWEDVHTELLSRFKTLSPKEWLEGTAVCRLKTSNGTRREIDWLCSWAEPTTPRITLGK